MVTSKIWSWNVNGLRSAIKKGFLDTIQQHQPDIICLQEIKTNQSIELDNYHSYWNFAKKKGYCGLAIFTREKPISAEYNLGIQKFDDEARILKLNYKDFILVNVHLPQGRRNLERMPFKMEFANELLSYCSTLLKQNKKIIISGDFNIAHKEIDLAKPKSNKKNTGFLPKEKEWLDKFISLGFADTFRELNKNNAQYTWWLRAFKCRERNIGWRFDYNFITKSHLREVKNAYILQNVFGSDHCPVCLELQT